MHSRLSILHCTSILDRGGIAASLCYLLPRLAAKGWQVEVAGFYGQGTFGRRLGQQDIPVHRLGLRSRYDLRALPRLVGLLRRGRYDVVHAHGFPSLYWVSLASCLVRGPRYVLSEHNVTNRRRDLPWLRPVERWVYGRYDRIVVVSQRVAAALVDWLPQVAGKVRVVHNGVPLASFGHPPEMRIKVRTDLSIPLGQPVLLFVGDLRHRKGADILLHAVTAPLLDSTLLLICGDGRLEQELQALARDLRLVDRVRFLGHRQDVPALMAAADVFVLSSRWEGGPLVVLEAMASRLPVVATTVGAVPEMIRDGEEGLLVPPGDPMALAGSIRELLDDPSLACHFSQQARIRVEEAFSVGEAAQKMAAVYKKLLEESR